MRYIIRAGDMREAERTAFEGGVRSIDLMELAARKVVDALIAVIGPPREKRVGFFCGPGNNGGDGYAAARLYSDAGGSAFVVPLADPATPDARVNAQRARERGIPILSQAPWPRMDTAVDALFGIGLTRPLSGPALQMVTAMNSLFLPVVVAVDIPSGMQADTGACGEQCVHASHTVTFAYPKPGHYLTSRPEAVGELIRADIGVHAPEGKLIPAADEEDLPHLLPRRSLAAHKGSNGRALLLCGSPGMAGAASFAALGCLRAGAGLTTLLCDEALFPILQVLAPGAQCAVPEAAAEEGRPFDVLLMGCGLGQTDTAMRRMRLLYDRNRPAVLDADALNLLAKRPFPLGEKTLLTPHVGEAARLLQCAVGEVQADMLGAARAISRKYGAVTLLKSHASVITDGDRFALNTVGSPALAKGGSGDALAGIATGLMAQGLPAFEAAQAAGLWLGSAARRAARCFGVYSALTGEVLSMMGEAACPPPS